VRVDNRDRGPALRRAPGIGRGDLHAGRVSGFG
jgi:hypothetical protein